MPSAASAGIGEDLWIGTWNGGLNQLRDDRVRAFPTASGLPHDLVLSICEGRDGSLWVGAGMGGGLARLLNGKSTHFSQNDGLINAAIRVIHEDHRGRVWLGTSQGLSCFQDGSFTNYTVKDNLAGDEVRAICEDHKGRLWFGTEGGLSRWEDGRFANITSTSGLSDNAVNALYEDREQNLWIGTASGGLNRMSLVESPVPPATSGRKTVSGNIYSPLGISSYTTRQGLFSDEIFEILEDDYGWLWLSCSRGVFRVQKKEFDALDQKKRKVLTCMAYGKSDGMESTLCNAVGKPAGWKSRDGRLWFPTTKGLIAIVPEFQLPQAPPPVFVEQLLVDKKLLGESISSEISGHSPLNSYVAHPLLIAAGRGELEFRYTALTFQTPEKALFKYRLEGVDSDWIEAGTRRVAYYNNTYPGRYRFRVMACNSDGVWNETGASLPILVQPHFWQTWSFRGLAIVAALGAAGALARYVTQKRLQRKLALLEQQHAIEKERGRIAKDIHDDLGSSLTFITMLGERSLQDLSRPGELAIHTGKIVGYARGAVQALDEIVWAVNPLNDTLDGLVGYLNQHASQIFENTNVRCRVDIPETLPALVLPAEVRHDLFLAVKEALNNALKHAQASEVCVAITEAGGVLEIAVQDNGRGFQAGDTRVRGGGNGLENMRKRMAKIGGEYCLSSAPGQGTKLKFTVRVKTDPSYDRTN